MSSIPSLSLTDLNRSVSTGKPLWKITRSRC